MLVTILIVSAIGAAVLIVLYLIARLSPPVVGESISFPFIVVARPWVILQEILEKGALYCDGVLEKTLRYPAGVTSDTWHGVLVIARIIILAVSNTILDADVYNTLQSLPLWFGGAGAVSLPGSFAIPSALLFVCMSALYGAVVLECVDLLPYGAGLFPKLTDRVKKWLGVSCGIGFVLSLVFAILFWGSRGYYISVDPEIPGVLAILVLSLVGLLATGASVLAFWGLVVGFTGLLSFVFWALSSAFHAASNGVSIVPSLLDVFVQHMTQGRISVRGVLRGHEPHKPPASPFPAFAGNRSPALLSQNAASIAAGKDEIVTTTTTITEVPMSDVEKAAGLIFVSMARMFLPVEQKINELRAIDRILSSTFLDLPVNHLDTAIPGIVDLSPTFAERNAAMVHSETEGQAMQTLLSGAGDRVVETHQPTKAFPAPLVSCTDCRYLVEEIEMLESGKRRLPLHPQAVVTEVDQEDLKDKIVQVGLADLQGLAEEDVVSTVLVTDPHSPFAASQGVDRQRLSVAHILVSLLNADKHSLHNHSFSTVLKLHHSQSPFTTIATCSLPVAVGKLPTRFGWLPGVKNHSGIGSYSDILAQSKAGIDRVMTDASTCMFPCQVEPNVASTVVVTVPIRLDDARFANCVRDNSLYVSSHYPHASCITVRGNGCAPLHHVGSRFFVQVARIMPLQPAELFRSHEDKSTSVKVTPLYPVTTALEPTNSNGHVPEQRTRKTKATKAVKPTRQKNAPSTRRGAKKNEKAAN